MDLENQTFVFATSHDGTSAAFRHAATITDGATRKVVLLVPRIVEYGSRLNGSCAPEEVEILTAPFRALARRAALDVTVRCVGARAPRHLPGRLLLAHARIIVGGPRGGWRRTPEQQLARDLACDGHDVTFVDVKSGQPHAIGVAVPA
jgi:hypothetical protein